MKILKDLGFKNLETGNIQSVDGMTVIPICVQNKLSEYVSSPNSISFERTRTYGSMVFSNVDTNSNNFGFVPANTMVLSKQQAQDHSLSKVEIVKPKTTETFDTACCVQSSQGGFLSGNEEGNEYDVLPLGLRKVLLNPGLRNEKAFGKLWPSIKSWMNGIKGISGTNAHLEYFFKPFKKELDEFVAEFEPIENQIGAVILFNDMVAGIEIMPTKEHWLYYWKWLIRGCYGAEMLKLRKIEAIKAMQIDVPESVSFNKIDEYLENIKNTILQNLNYNYIIKEIRKYQDDVETKLIHTLTGGGDIIYKQNVPVYLSFVA